MLVHDFTYIDAPAGVVRACLLDDSHTWMDALATQAAAEGDKVRLRLGPRGAHSPVGKLIEVEVGQAVARDAATLIPLTWRATGAAALFPVFSGDIEVAAIGGSETQLSIWGHYDPPLGVLGEALDRFGLHRMAEASVRAFLLELALAVEERGRVRAAS
jgi:hypothetical protein